MRLVKNSFTVAFPLSDGGGYRAGLDIPDPVDFELRSRSAVCIADIAIININRKVCIGSKLVVDHHPVGGWPCS